jgi:anti-sigma factor RsiW
MSYCNNCAIKILHYLNSDLEGEELCEFCNHVDSCARCRAHLEAEEALSKLFDRTRQLYPASAALRARVAATVQQGTATWSAARTFSHEFQTFGGPPASMVQRVTPVRVLVPAFLAILAFVMSAKRRAS